MNIKQQIENSYWNRDGRTPFQVAKCMVSDGDLSPEDLAEAFPAELAAEEAERADLVARQAKAARETQEREEAERAFLLALLAKHGATEENLARACKEEGGPVHPAAVEHVGEENGALVARLAQFGYASRRWEWSPEVRRFVLRAAQQEPGDISGEEYSKVD